MQQLHLQAPETARAARAGAYLFGTAARAGSYLLGAAVDLGKAALVSLGLTPTWRAGVFYGLDRVATVTAAKLRIRTVGGDSRTSVEVMTIRLSLPSEEPVEGDAQGDLSGAAEMRQAFQGATAIDRVYLVGEGRDATVLRRVFIPSTIDGLDFTGKHFAVVLIDHDRYDSRPEVLAVSDGVSVLGAHASMDHALRQFRDVGRQMGHENLGNVKGSPWARHGAQRSFLGRWARRLVKIVLALLVFSWLGSMVLPHGRGLPAMTGLASPAQATRADISGVSAGALAGANSATADAQAAQVVQAAVAQAEAATAAGQSTDTVVAQAWNRLSPEDQQKLLRAVAGEQPGAQSPVAGGVTSAQQANPAAPARTLEQKEMVAVLRAASLGVHAGKKGAPAVIVFEDPLCQSCREFATSAVPANIPVAVVPIAFQAGAAGWASKALCSPDVVKTWSALITTGLQPAAKDQCAEGDDTIARNNDLFRNLGFNATPTLVAPNGRVMVGAPDPETLAAWYQANLK